MRFINRFFRRKKENLSDKLKDAVCLPTGLKAREENKRKKREKELWQARHEVYIQLVGLARSSYSDDEFEKSIRDDEILYRRILKRTKNNNEAEASKIIRKLYRLRDKPHLVRNIDNFGGFKIWYTENRRRYKEKTQEKNLVRARLKDYALAT